MIDQRRFRLALDQNFPTPLITDVAPYLPHELEVRSLRAIDPRLSELDDRSLFIALHQLGWDGLITNNYRMLAVPAELAAIVKTKAIVVAIRSLGHDPLRAVGALLLELPGLAERVRPNTSNVFQISYRRRTSEDAWTYFQAAARQLAQDPASLWNEVGVLDDELHAQVLPDSTT